MDDFCYDWLYRSQGQAAAPAAEARKKKETSLEGLEGGDRFGEIVWEFTEFIVSFVAEFEKFLS